MAMPYLSDVVGSEMEAAKRRAEGEPLDDSEMAKRARSGPILEPDAASASLALSRAPAASLLSAGLASQASYGPGLGALSHAHVGAGLSAAHLPPVSQAQLLSQSLGLSLPPGLPPEQALQLQALHLQQLGMAAGPAQLPGLTAEMLAMATGQGGPGGPGPGAHALEAAAGLGQGLGGGLGGLSLPLLGDLQHLPLDPGSLAALAGGPGPGPGGQGGGGGLPPLDYMTLQQLPAELLAQLSAGNLPFSLLPGAGMGGGGYGPGPGSMGGSHPGSHGGAPQADPNMVYKNWWDESDEKELQRLVSDPDYRRLKLGSEELDWPQLEARFRRSQNALRKKYWMLSKAPQGVHQNPRPRAERKNWTDEETEELKAAVAMQGRDGGEGADWEALAARFGTSVQTVKRKHRHSVEQAAMAASGAGAAAAAADRGKRQHHRKNVPYRWMIVFALSHLGMEGTALQIFDSIEQYPPFVEQLDTRIMPGTKHVPRWKIQVRKVLSADHIFLHTGQKHKHETVWRLDPKALQEANAERQRARAGLPPMQFPDALRDGDSGGAADLPQQLDLAALAATDPSVLAGSNALVQHMLEAAAAQQHAVLMGAGPSGAGAGDGDAGRFESAARFMEGQAARFEAGAGAQAQGAGGRGFAGPGGDAGAAGGSGQAAGHGPGGGRYEGTGGVQTSAGPRFETQGGHGPETYGSAQALNYEGRGAFDPVGGAQAAYEAQQAAAAAFHEAPDVGRHFGEGGYAEGRGAGVFRPPGEAQAGYARASDARGN